MFRDNRARRNNKSVPCIRTNPLPVADRRSSRKRDRLWAHERRIEIVSATALLLTNQFDLLFILPRADLAREAVIERTHVQLNCGAYSSSVVLFCSLTSRGRANMTATLTSPITFEELVEMAEEAGVKLEITNGVPTWEA